MHGVKRDKQEGGQRLKTYQAKRSTVNLLNRILNASDVDAARATTPKDRVIWTQRNDTLRQIIRQL